MVDLVGSDHTMVSRRSTEGEIIRTRNDDSVHSFAQDLEVLIRALEIHMRSSMKTIQKLHHRELDLEAAAHEANYEHEDEVKDFMKRIANLKLEAAALEEKLDQGEDLFPSGDDGPLVSNDRDYESSTEGSHKRRRHSRGRRTRGRRTGGCKDD